MATDNKKRSKSSKNMRSRPRFHPSFDAANEKGIRQLDVMWEFTSEDDRNLRETTSDKLAELLKKAY